MPIEGVLSGLFAAVVVGALARLVIRDNAPIGCILTILVGLVGSALGLAVGHRYDWGFFRPRSPGQIVIAALIVLPFARCQRP